MEVITDISTIHKLLEATKISDRIDAYAKLNIVCSKNTDLMVSAITEKSIDIVKVLKSGISSKNKEEQDSALLLLNGCLSHQNIVEAVQATEIEIILSSLLKVLESNNEKSTLVRGFWCLRHQKIEPNMMSNYIKRIIHLVKNITQTSDCQYSETVLRECFGTLKRLTVQCRSEMQDEICNWIVFPLEYICCHLEKTRESALDLIFTNIESIEQQHKAVSEIVHKEFKRKNMAVELKSLFENSKNQVFVLKTWTCLSIMLGKRIFSFPVAEVLNPLLKIANKAYTSKDNEIALAANVLWRALTDVFFLGDERCQSEIIRMFVGALVIRRSNPKLSIEILRTQWHLLCKIGDKINDHVTTMIFPILELHLGAKSLLKIKTSDQATRKKNIAANDTQVLSMMAAELLNQLLNGRGEIQSKDKVYAIEQFNGVPINDDHLKRSLEKFLEFSTNAVYHASTQFESLVVQLCMSFMERLHQISRDDVVFSKKVWPLILNSMKKMMSDHDYSVSFALKVLSMIPAEALSLFVCVPWKTTDIKERLFILMIEIIFNEQFIQKNALDQEKYFVLYEKLIKAAFSGEFEQLSHANFIINKLPALASLLSDQDMSWRLWSTFTHQLENYISKTNTVTEESKSTGNDFGTIHKTLLYPVKDMEMKLLMDSTLKELLVTWKELFTSFCRSVNLISGLEKNVGSEGFIEKLSEYIGANKEKLEEEKFVRGLLKMADVCLNSMQFESTPIFNQRATPTKLSRKVNSNNTLDGCKLFVDFVVMVFELLWENTSTKAISLMQVMVDWIDLIEKLINQLQSNDILKISCKKLSKGIVQILSHHKKYPKILLRTEKLVIAIFRKFEANKSQISDGECFEAFETILLACVRSERKELIKKTAHFWNHNFGKNKNIIIPQNLEEAFLASKSKIKFLTPMKKSNIEDFLPHDDMAMFENIATSAQKSPKSFTSPAKTFTSPAKQHGSFLAFGLKHSPAKGNSPMKAPFNDSPLSASKKKIRKHLSKDDFVEIKEYPKRKRLLTEHQKEKLTERKSLPAMYNNLDQSQDTLLFKRIMQDSSCSQSSQVLDELSSQSTQLERANVNQASDELTKVNENPMGNDKKQIMQTNKKPVQDLNDNSSSEDKTDKNPSDKTDKNLSDLTKMDKVNDSKKGDESSSVEILDTPSTKSFEIETINVTSSEDNTDMKEIENPDIIPSSQTQPDEDTDIPDTVILRNVNKTCLQENPSQHFKESTPPLVFKTKQSILTPKSLQKKKSRKSVDPRIHKEPKIVVSKLPSSAKRKRSSLDHDNEKKRRKSEGDILMRFLKKENEQSPKDGVKKNSPVAGRTRRKKQEKEPLSIKKATKKNRGGAVEVNVNRQKPSTSSVNSENPNPKNSEKNIQKDDIDAMKPEENRSKIDPIDSTKTETKSSTETGAIGSPETEPKDGHKNKNASEEMEENPIGSVFHSAEEQNADTEKVSKANPEESETEVVDTEMQIESENMNTTDSKEMLKEPQQENDIDIDKDFKKTDIRKIPSEKFHKELPEEKENSGVCINRAIDNVLRNEVQFGVIKSLPTPSFMNRKSVLSPATSPVNGILKKRGKDSPSTTPPVKSRRVSFQLPGGVVLAKENVSDLDIFKFPDDDITFAKPSPGSKRKKKLSSLVEKTEKPESEKKPVFPELMECTTSIEKILPSLAFARGIGHVVRAKNIHTVGDLSALSENQIENLPFRSPKVATVKNALQIFSTQSQYKSIAPKSPLFAEKANEKTVFDDLNVASKSTKEQLFDEALMLATPSRKEQSLGVVHVKPTSLFHDDNEIKKPETVKSVSNIDNSEKKLNDDSFDDIVAINDSITDDAEKYDDKEVIKTAKGKENGIAKNINVSNDTNVDTASGEKNSISVSISLSNGVTLSKSQPSDVANDERQSNELDFKTVHKQLENKLSDNHESTNDIESDRTDNTYIIPETESLVTFSNDTSTANEATCGDSVEPMEINTFEIEELERSNKLLSNLSENKTFDTENNSTEVCAANAVIGVTPTTSSKDVANNISVNKPNEKVTTQNGINELTSQNENAMERDDEILKTSSSADVSIKDRPSECNEKSVMSIETPIQINVTTTENEINKELDDCITSIKDKISGIKPENLSSSQLFSLMSFYKTTTAQLYEEIEKRFNK